MINYPGAPPHGIRVNVVAPQLLDTPTNRAMFPAEVMAKAVAPEGRPTWRESL